MFLQESVISVDEKNYMRLSGPLSVWLHTSCFWLDFNARHGTIFDQFEEDEADMSMVKAIIEALDDRICVLHKLSEDYVEFVFSWDAEYKSMSMRLPKNFLLSELVVFRDFLNDVVAKNCCVLFSL